MRGLGLDQLKAGQSAQASRTVTANDLVFYSHASGDLNPLHLPEVDGDGDGTPEGLCPPAYLAALLSALIGSRLPGPGSRETDWALRTGAPARIGDRLTVRVEIKEIRTEDVLIAGEVSGPTGTAMSAEITVAPPERPAVFGPHDLPDLLIRRYRKFERLVAACDGIDPAITAVVCPYTEESLEGALDAATRELITPILVGETAKIEAAALAAERDLTGIGIIDAASASEAAGAAARLVAEGGAHSLMKGHLHTDTILRAVLDRAHGLRGERRISHVFVLDMPGVDHLLFVTDAAVNIAPDLKVKMDIAQNSIDLARALGITLPKVGVLSAVEKVNPALPSSLDAAALSKMADRGQITGGLVDGPLAMDNAVDLEAAQIKGLTGEVAGRAEILIAPNLEAGNMLAKELTFVARAESAGVVVGARAPVVVTSRADSEFSRLVSCAVAALHAQWLRTGKPAPALLEADPS
ncbi:MAG: bifunctional enoyl-CoA hydratase/phosphate acetyltransferase [Pseudomonadota bacterium]